MLLSLLTQSRAELHRSGENVHSTFVGSLTCVECGYALAAAAMESLPRCPACGGSRFRRASIFEHPTVDADAVEPAATEPAWLTEVRAVESEQPRIAFEERGERVVFELRQRWNRIGRTRSADVTLDDPSVSRRHALVVRTSQGALRALDDRSLNGLFVNGERVDWAPLRDGDELEIGRYRLYVIALS